MLGCRIDPMGEMTWKSDQRCTKFRATARIIVLSSLTVLLANCGGGGSGGDDTPPRIVSVAITPTDPSPKAGTTVQLVATATYTNGATENVTSSAVWSSDAPPVASVSNTGQVSTHSVGEVEIEAIVSGRPAKATVSVKSAYAQTILHTFGPGPDGMQPTSLIRGGDGNFYGVTTSGGHRDGPGGAEGSGTVYMITPDGHETTLFAFGEEGAKEPVGTIIQTSDGSLYGITIRGSPDLWGYFYKLSP
jgi:hypothetical protein